MEFNATLVVMAAGMGSRFGGLKQVEPVGRNGEAILDFSVYDAMEAGFNKVVFVIKKAIEKEFKELVGNRIAKKVKVEYAYQELDAIPEGFSVPEGREKPWGTGHAILCCKGIVNEPFAVINADDYYGKTGFKKIYEQLKNDNENYCMVGFRLANTLTENGSVARGVCSVEDGFLTDIDERTKIYSDCTYETENGELIGMEPDTIVSMNMWGFNTDLFKYLELAFNNFLKEKGNELKSECYLPMVVGELIKNGEKKAKVLASEDKWYGVTYREDKDSVVKAIGELIDKGMYDNM